MLAWVECLQLPTGKRYSDVAREHWKTSFRLHERTEFVEGCAPLIRRLSRFGRSDPFSDGVSRQPGTLGYLMQRQLVAKIHPPNFAHHFHADHHVFSCSKIEQKQLNTWVSFQSAEQPLLGQFSVSGNIFCPNKREISTHYFYYPCNTKHPARRVD